MSKKLIGTVAWFNFNKGFGFIFAGEKDYFVHHSGIAVGQPGRRTLEKQQAVEFEVTQRNGRDTAINVRPLSNDTQAGGPPYAQNVRPLVSVEPNGGSNERQ
jgi:CspA family cold shock protein